MILRLGGFASSALDDYLRRTGSRLELVIRTAASYYLADRAKERPSWHVPQFADGVAAEEAKSLTVDLDEETANVLTEEATRQCVAPAQVAEHALLYFLADLDSGRVAERLRNAVQEDNP